MAEIWARSCLPLRRSSASLFMPDRNSPWPPYEGRTSLVSDGRSALTAALADVVRVRAGFASHELPEIFSAPADDGENDAARDLIRHDAEHMTRMFVNGRITTFARPLDGGDVVGISPTAWEIDDPLNRFATGALNLDRWWEIESPPTHRIFVDRQQFDEWLAGLKPLGFLTSRQVEEIVDPQLRAQRAVAERRMKSELPQSASLESTVSHSKQDAGDPPGVCPLLLDVSEEMIGRSNSTIYADVKKGAFPEGIKLGSSTRWMRTEVLAWIEEQAAKCGDR